MIVFDLECRSGGHRFEAWFAGSNAFAEQQQRGLLCCPQCGSANVAKAASAPNLGRKGNQVAGPQPAKAPPVMSAGALEMLGKLAKLQADALKNSTWVGPKFAAQSRAMHYGDQEMATIHGQATPAEAQGLAEEGIAVLPLLVPVTPPEELN